MSILKYLLAMAVLVFGSTLLWLISEAVAGNEEMILHFGNMTLATILGMVAFVIWGWLALGIVLAAFGLLWIAGGLHMRMQ
jgi:hypothetical protein